MEMLVIGVMKRKVEFRERSPLIKNAKCCPVLYVSPLSPVISSSPSPAQLAQESSFADLLRVRPKNFNRHAVDSSPAGVEDAKPYVAMR